jgi:hypothetical protein
MLMDGTKANRSAQRMLKAKFPSMMQISCQAHALNLFIKDLANPKKTTWASSIMAKSLMMCNVINDNELIKAHVQKEQKDLYKKTKAFAAPCPTRFANHVFCMRDLEASKNAIKATASAEGWDSISSSCSKADDFTQAAVLGRTVWAGLTSLLELLRPATDAIHTIEADK